MTPNNIMVEMLAKIDTPQRRANAMSRNVSNKQYIAELATAINPSYPKLIKKEIWLLIEPLRRMK